MTRHLTKAFLITAAVMLILSPCVSFASEADILKRLEQMEKQISNLKKENAELREMVGKQPAAEDLRQMVEADRKDIEELKASSGLATKGGLKAVLGKYDVQLYGRVKVDINYDTADFRNYNDFLGVVGVGANENDSTNFNPRDTRFGLKVARRDGVWLSEARMEMDFYGTNAGNNLVPRMRLGYVKITNDDWKASLTVGQDWIPVAQLNPATIDFGILAAAGNLWWRVPQVTLRKDVGNFELLLSAMRHRRINTAEDTNPWTLARIAYKNGILGKGGIFAIGGGFCSNNSTNAFGQRDDVDRWLLALEFKMVMGKFTFVMEPWIGEGLDREFLRYDMGINPQDNVLVNRRGEEPDTIRSRGGFVSLSYKATPRLSMAAGYGIDDPDKSDMKGMKGFLNDRQFTQNQMYFFNTWYAVTSAVKMGFEVMYLETERFSDSDNGMRFTFSTSYLF